MKALRDDIGLKDRHIHLTWENQASLLKAKEEATNLPEYDHTTMYLMNAFFTNIDMTEYEDAFMGPGQDLKFEIGQGASIWHHQGAKDIHPGDENEAWWGESEEMKWGLSQKWQDSRDEIPEEEEDEYPEDLDDEDDEDEYNNGIDNEEDHEPLEWPPKRIQADPKPELDFFDRHETLNDRYNDEEIDSFLKLMNVKPHRMWRNKSLFHHSMGVHAYEDDAQRLDPEYHLLAEVERKHVERWQIQEHRRGAEVRFDFEGNNKAVYPKFKY